MWINIILTSILSAICSFAFIKLSYGAFEPENRVPFWVKAIGVSWLLFSGVTCAAGLLFLIWS